MGIRMSSNQFTYNYTISLNKAYQNQAKLFEQADGSSIHRPSDSAIDYAKLLRYNNSAAENDQYQRNVKNALSWMNTSDSSLVHIAEIMKTFNDKTISASNDHNNEADFEAIGKEMLVQIQEIVSTSNAQEGDRFVFSGQRDLVKPFTMSDSLVDRGLAKTLDSAQVGFFKNLVVDEQTYVTQMLTLNDDDGNYYYLDTENGSIYTKEFMDSGYRDSIANGAISGITGNAAAIKVRAGYIDGGVYVQGKGTFDPNFDPSSAAAGEDGFDSSTTTGFTVSNFFDNRGVLKTTDDNGNALENNITMMTSSGSEVTLHFSTIQQRIVNYFGNDKGISMVKLNGAADPASDTINVTGTEIYGNDIFDNSNSGNDSSGCAMLNEMLAVYAQVQSCNSKWLSSDGVTIAKVSHNTVTIAETKLGARAQLYNSVSEMLENQADNITEDITNVSSTDVAKLAVKLMEMSTLYNMSLSMGGRILPQSLADYL